MLAWFCFGWLVARGRRVIRMHAWLSCCVLFLLLFLLCLLWLGIAATLQRAGGFLCLLFFRVAGLLYECRMTEHGMGMSFLLCVWTERGARGLAYEVLLAKYFVHLKDCRGR